MGGFPINIIGQDMAVSVAQGYGWGIGFTLWAVTLGVIVLVVVIVGALIAHAINN